MSKNNHMSRSYRQMKRRKNKQIILSLILLALLFVFILFVLIFKNSSEDKSFEENYKEENNISEVNESEPPNLNIEENKEDENEQTNNDNESIDEEIVIQYIDSDDHNVIEAFVGNWKPIGTIQEEPHTTNFNDNSQDRIEIREAVLSVTHIMEDNLVELWIGNGGEQKVIATVKDRSNDDIYRVYLSWIEFDGWKVTLVEKLKQYNP